MPFCVDFYTHDFGRELFSDTVKTYFLSSFQQTEVREEQELPAAVSSVNDVLPNLVVPCPASGRSVLCGPNFGLSIQCQSRLVAEYACCFRLQLFERKMLQCS